jgi:ABC-type amino acid transport substrate-binding protein
MKRLLTILCTALLLVAPLVRAADLQEIKARGELRHLGIKYANFVTGAGDGLDVELVQGFAKHIGVKYTLVYSDFYTIIRDLLGKDVSVAEGKATLSGDFSVKGDMIATGFTVLPWRKQVLLYSDTVFPTQVLLVARADAAQKPVIGGQSLARDIQDTKAMIGKKSLLVMEKTCLDPAGYGLKGKGLDLRPYTKNTNINEMVPAMLNGVAEYTLLDVADVILDLQKWAGHIKVLGPISEEQEMAAAFPPDAPQLRDAYNEYLRKVKADGTYDKLVRKYYPGIHTYFPEYFAKLK